MMVGSSFFLKSNIFHGQKTKGNCEESSESIKMSGPLSSMNEHNKKKEKEKENLQRLKKMRKNIWQNNINRGERSWTLSVL